MEYKIEKNILIPRVKTCNKYPFGEMDIGDSFIISKEYSRKLMTKYSNAARNYGKKQNPIKIFKFRKVKNRQIRAWRTQ